jgi:hypothetical protein
LRLRTPSAAGFALAGALAVATPGAANVEVGSSAWRWGNPLPQGNAIVTMDFAGGTGYAAGGFGTLLEAGCPARTPP